MTIQVELSPETEARLLAAAAQHGLAPEQYAGDLLHEALAVKNTAFVTLTAKELHSMLEEAGEGFEGRPSLPTSAFTRDSFYEDRM